MAPLGTSGRSWGRDQTPSRRGKRAWARAASAGGAGGLAESAEPIARVPVPSREVFEREYLHRSRPVVITGVVERWPAFTRWSTTYFRERFGRMRTTVGHLQDGRIFTDPARGIGYELTTIDRGMALVCSGNGNVPLHYLMAPLRFPEFRRAHVITVDVGPGDLLFVPSRWWHQVRTLETSFSINWWWPSEIWNAIVDAAEILQKRIRRVRLVIVCGLPAGARR